MYIILILYVNNNIQLSLFVVVGFFQHKVSCAMLCCVLCSPWCWHAGRNPRGATWGSYFVRMAGNMPFWAWLMSRPTTWWSKPTPTPPSPACRYVAQFKVATVPLPAVAVLLQVQSFSRLSEIWGPALPPAGSWSESDQGPYVWLWLRVSQTRAHMDDYDSDTMRIKWRWIAPNLD